MARTSAYPPADASSVVGAVQLATGTVSSAAQLKKRYLKDEVKYLKWSPKEGQILAIATVSVGSMIRMLEWRDGMLQKKEKISGL